MDQIEIRRKMFGEEVVFLINNVSKDMVEIVVDEVYLEGLRLQRIFNFFDKKSDLSILNKNRKIKANKDLLFVIGEALKICKITEGLYDISLGKQFHERKIGIEITKVKCSYKDIAMKNGEIELLHPDVMIDLGSIAKGYIADKLAEMLREKGILSGLIDARGDIILFGEEEQIIEIQHPRDKEKNFREIKVRNCGIATSGDYNQYSKNFENSHIINKNELISVTTLAPTLMEADLYATAIIVTPKEKIENLLNRNKKIKALCIDKNLSTIEFNNFEEVVG